MPTDRERMELPPRPFLYTIDQLSTLTQIPEATLKRSFIHYEERSIGFRRHEQMSARNIAPNGEKPDWRIVEKEFVRWLRYKGFRVYNRISVYR